MARRVTGWAAGMLLHGLAILAALPGAGLLLLATRAERGADRLRAWGRRE
jgi:hypothetical protein